MADFRTEWDLRGALLGEQRFDLLPTILGWPNTMLLDSAFPTPLVEENNPTVMTLFAHDWEDIVAGRSFTQCDRIRESNCIHHSQYIQLLRQLRHNHLLDSNEHKVDKKPYVLLLRRLLSKLVQFFPKEDNTRDICTHIDPSYCSIKNHLHRCPYDFLKTLGTDLLTTKVVDEHQDPSNVGHQDPSDDVGLYVTEDIAMVTHNLQEVVRMLQQ